ncbi:TSUP family transporter [Corynebacterium mendelii]|uniref:Probable membrane transporter protein n=1 Tax=Corynebacterium mendelii TaxID=2765362 RepID=A0A939IWL8_9CORY|nr:TSUP family transporter [Corynebacterium mendelii]MBN9643163.1 TSUP family transporter [Corynebacterium mendelii]
MIVLACVVFVMMMLGAGVQRVTGLGFGLVAATGLSLVLGPVGGIVLLNVVGLVFNLVMIRQVWREISWSKVALLAPWAAAATIPGAWLITVTPTAVLQVIVGVVLVAALAVVTVGRNRIRPTSSRWAAITAGTASGLAATVAGVPGPPLTVYAQATGWKGPGFVASLQPVFTVTTLATLAAKGGAGLVDVSVIPWWVWVTGSLGMVTGLAAGTVIAGKVDENRAFTVTVLLAAVGALAVVAQGAAAVAAG